MQTVQWVPTLMFVTLVAAAGFGVIQLLAFLRRRSNRDAAEHALAGTGARSDYGALPELAGVGAIALVAIGLLTIGYNGRSDTRSTASDPAPTTTSASATDRMTDPARPRANPADMAQPPTQYPLGSGSATTAPTNPSAMAPAHPETTGAK